MLTPRSSLPCHIRLARTDRAASSLLARSDIYDLPMLFEKAKAKLGKGLNVGCHMCTLINLHTDTC